MHSTSGYKIHIKWLWIILQITTQTVTLATTNVYLQTQWFNVLSQVSQTTIWPSQHISSYKICYYLHQVWKFQQVSASKVILFYTPTFVFLTELSDYGTIYVPIIDTSLSIHQLKLYFTRFFWREFSTKFTSDLPCTMHIVCPFYCCSTLPVSVNYESFNTINFDQWHYFTHAYTTNK